MNNQLREPKEVKVWFNACQSCEWEDLDGYPDLDELPEVEQCPDCKSPTTIRSEWVQE